MIGVRIADRGRRVGRCDLDGEMRPRASYGQVEWTVGGLGKVCELALD